MISNRIDISVKVEPTTKVQKEGIYRYCNFEDGSESHPGHTLKEDLQKDNDHSEVLLKKKQTSWNRN